MFEPLNISFLENCDIHLSRPDELLSVQDGKNNYHPLYKGALNYLYKQLGLGASTSKEVFKISEDIWNNLINYLLKGEDTKKAQFDFNDKNVRYFIDEYKNVIDIENMNDEIYDQTKTKMEEFILEISSIEHTKKFYFEGNGGLIKLVLYRADADIAKNKYTPVVIYEINTKKSEYSVYTGILIYEPFTFIPSMNPVSVYNCYSNFINSIDIFGTLEMSENNAENLYCAYLDFKSSKIEISARELIRMLQKVGYKLELKEDLSLDDIEKMHDEKSNATIKDFFNSFRLTTGETAEDILNLSELKKVFKYNKLTIVDLLEILSGEYLSDDGAKITASILSDLVFGLYTRKTDVIDVKEVISDIENN